MDQTPDTMNETSAEPDALAPYSADICAHMNADHADAMILYCAAYAGVEAAHAEMVLVTTAGFDIRAEDTAGVGQIVRIAFPTPVSTPQEVRQAMVQMLKRARQGQV